MCTTIVHNLYNVYLIAEILQSRHQLIKLVDEVKSLPIKIMRLLESHFPTGKKNYTKNTFIFKLLKGPFSSKDISKFRFLQVINSSSERCYYQVFGVKVFKPSRNNRKKLWIFNDDGFYVTAGFGLCVLNDTEGKVQAFCDEHQCKLYVHLAPIPSRHHSNGKNLTDNYVVFSAYYKKKISSEKLERMMRSILLKKTAIPRWHVDFKNVCNCTILQFFYFALVFLSFCITFVVLSYFYGK